ncbi:hypothetical protein VUR80DRAFT_535 [Thermomyces stellatus]
MTGTCWVVTKRISGTGGLKSARLPRLLSFSLAHGKARRCLADQEETKERSFDTPLNGDLTGSVGVGGIRTKLAGLTVGCQQGDGGGLLE